MSAVVSRTAADRWSPEELGRVFSSEQIVAGPVVNRQERVAWITVESRQGIRWADVAEPHDTTYHLHVLHWDRDAHLLYVDSSDLGSLHEDLADRVCPGAERLINNIPYRVLGGLGRPIPTNVGVLDLRSASRRFSMHVGVDVYEGFTIAE